MAGVARRLNLVVATVFANSLVWIGIVGLNKGALDGLFTLRTGGAPTNVAPPLQQTPAAGPTGAPLAPQPSQTFTPMVAAGELVGDRLIIPVQGIKAAQLTDTFTQARAGGARLHDAIDIMAPVGTPVLAAAPGAVEKLFVSKDGGNTIYLRSRDRLAIYYYAHLDRYAPGLTDGQAVRAGEVLGTVGYTGNANPAGPHLHFAVWLTAADAKWYGEHRAVNPYPLLTKR